jgi:hypothetical protein
MIDTDVAPEVNYHIATEHAFTSISELCSLYSAKQE